MIIIEEFWPLAISKPIQQKECSFSIENLKKCELFVIWIESRSLQNQGFCKIKFHNKSGVAPTNFLIGKHAAPFWKAFGVYFLLI